MRAQCQKCQSKSAWIAKTEFDILLKCMCGYQKVLFTLLVDSLESEGEDFNEDESETRLPKKGTNLFKTLVVLSILPECTSKEITDRLNELNGVMRVPGKIYRADQLLTVSDVSSYLTILRGKGLVERVEVRRGVLGGSSWLLTQVAVDLLDDMKD